MFSGMRDKKTEVLERLPMASDWRFTPLYIIGRPRHQKSKDDPPRNALAGSTRTSKFITAVYVLTGCFPQNIAHLLSGRIARVRHPDIHGIGRFVHSGLKQIGDSVFPCNFRSAGSPKIQDSCRGYVVDFWSGNGLCADELGVYSVENGPLKREYP